MASQGLIVSNVFGFICGPDFEPLGINFGEERKIGKLVPCYL